MPHITIEYSDNLSVQLDEKKLARALHDEVNNHDIDATKIKTRTVELNNYIVGNETDQTSMVHVSILILPGRGEDFCATLGKDCHNTLTAILGECGIEKCAASLEMREMKTEFYFK